jgi:hypothetical protein
MTPAPNSTAARGAARTCGSAGTRDGVEAGSTADIAAQRHVFARLVQATSPSRNGQGVSRAVAMINRSTVLNVALKRARRGGLWTLCTD